jgi:hypothetical protein
MPKRKDGWIRVINYNAVYMASPQKFDRGAGTTRKGFNIRTTLDTIDVDDSFKQSREGAFPARITKRTRVA